MKINNTDKYVLAKKRLAKIMGYAVLLVSFKFSADGFGFNTHDSLFVGWILALAVTTAQLIFNTQVRNLNWTIVVVGVVSYAYSIWTNIMGFYAYRGATEIVLDMSAQSFIAIFGGAFLDIFPEMALAWAYGAGSDGDLVGNLVKIGQGETPDKKMDFLGTSTPSYPPTRPMSLHELVQNQGKKPTKPYWSEKK